MFRIFGLLILLLGLAILTGHIAMPWNVGVACVIGGGAVALVPSPRRVYH